MPKSKSLVKTESAKDAHLTTKISSGSPYQLDPAQVERAATALVAHMKKHAQEKAEATGKKDLLADDDEPSQNDTPIYLTLATKKHIKDQNRLKPKKIKLPHSLQPESVKICLISVDPQRKYKDLVADPAFPEELRGKIGRVIGLEKLKKKYKPFESKRQIMAEYDVFLADDRIVTALPGILGKTFYSGKGKRPIPVYLQAGTQRSDKSAPQKKEDKPGAIGTAHGVAQEIQTALHSTLVNLSSSANTAIKVGTTSMSSQQIRENLEAVVSALTDRLVPQGWRNIRVLHIKGPATQALPIWLADELWTDEKQVLDEPYKPVIKEGVSQKQKTKRKWDDWEEEMLDEEELAEKREHMNKAKRSRKAKREQKGSISKEKRKALKTAALESVHTPLIAG
ncbi:ribosomal protein L1p/L10e family-domain-containing protein [Lophiotrema nucula]|uniref:Ribosomal protein L1p/L10e family-domain-containing protein n=1 Tax=Lophiotrema nucula TaxID=690887 RepID=A0A6A5ZRN7_9PLEO|nr:ribosomal protein L1p/L10e family-domain-containing protein [Lophiotrema nucula]